MSFVAFKEKIDAIGLDLGYRAIVAEDAGTLLRNAITKRCDGRIPDWATYWTEAVDSDFAEAGAELEKLFTETTQERAQGLAKYQGRKVVQRVTRVWLEGATYRIPLARSWSYEASGSRELKWAAEITEFGRRMCGAPRYGLTQAERKRLERDCHSEYLAERAMKDLFESAFRVTLDP